MLIPLKTISDPRYYKWYFKSIAYIDALSSTSNLVRDGQAMRWANFIQLPILFPSATEQHQIADFLDRECSEIDILASDIQIQIDILEQYKRSMITETITKGLNPNTVMKDSGVQWLGLIPSTWGCRRGKYLLTYIQKPVKDDDGVITCFRDGEVTLRTNRREDGFTMADKEIGYQGIDVGDLVVHGMDGFAGAIGISDSRGKASPVINVLDTKQNKRSIMYYLRSLAYGDVFLAMSTGIRVRSCDLRWNKLSELRYPVPSLREQQIIVEYIDNMIEKTNAVIADKQEQLVILDEYKKSLIYEYVTGKKEVPN
jgi:type I restriction enzyme S subunit